MDIYLTLWVIIQYYSMLLLKLFQPWQLEAFAVGSCIPLAFDIPLLCVVCFFSTSLLSGTTRCSRLTLSVSCHGSFYWRVVLGTKVWALGVLIANGVSLRLGPLI